MRNKFAATVIGIAALGVIGAFAQTSSSPVGEGGPESATPASATPACPNPGMGQAMGRGPGLGQGMKAGMRMGPGQGTGMCALPGSGTGPRMGCGPNMASPDNMCPGMDLLPDEIKARMETVRAERRDLCQAWAKAVASRGETSVTDLRAAFNRDNGTAIAQYDAERAKLAQDMDAIRQGYDAHVGEPPAPAMKGGDADEIPFVTPGPGNGRLRAAIETDIVTRINAQTKPLTAETYAGIVGEVLAEHRRDIAGAFRNPPCPAMGPMAPDLARMREEMGRVRDSSWGGQRRALRAQLRAAMQIQDARAREEAVREVLKNYSDKDDESGEE